MENTIDFKEALPQTEVLAAHLAVILIGLPGLAPKPLALGIVQTNVEHVFDIALEVIVQIVGRYFTQVVQVGIKLLHVHQVHVGIVKVVDDKACPTDKRVHW